MVLDVTLERGFFYLVLKNAGDEPAVDVVTKIGPRIPGPDGVKPINELRIFGGVPYFAAGKEFSIPMGPAAARFSARQATKFKAAISYSDQSGNSYEESMVHDLEIYRDLPQKLDARKSTAG